MKLARNIILFQLALLWALLLIAAPVGANTAANTQITAQTQVSYFDGTATQTVTASVTITVDLVAAAPNIVTGSSQSVSYANAGTTLTDSFTITATSNGPDTYSFTASVTVPPAGSNNTTPPGVTAPANVILGATITTTGSDATNIIVPSDGTADSVVNEIQADDWVVIGSNPAVQVLSVVDPGTNGIATITLKTPITAPGAGVTVAEQKTVTAAVTAGTIIQTGTDVTISATITATSASFSGATTTSGAILNTFYSGVAGFAKYVRNVTTSVAGTGIVYSYNSINYYQAGIMAKPGDILEYLLVSSNIGSGTVSAAVVTDVLPTSFVTLRDNAYGSGRELTYVSDANVLTTLTKAADSDQADYNITTPNTLTVNVGTGASNINGGTIPAGKSVLVLYQVNVNNPVQGDKIVNSARLSSPDITPPTSSVTVTTVIRTPSDVKFLNACGGQPVIGYMSGGTIYIQVTDLDQNIDTTAQTVTVVLTNLVTGGDTETVTLTETGPSNGIFCGSIPSSGSTSTLNDGTLTVVSDSRIQATYTDPLDQPSQNSTAMAMIDPQGVVFDSSAGEGVQNTVVTLRYWDNVSNSCDLTRLPELPDGQVNPAAATGANGTFAFPLVYPGDYCFEVTQPSNYTYPSVVSVPDLSARFPSRAIGDGSYGGKFTLRVNDPILILDIPVDPSTAASLWLQKTASKDTAGHGDYIPYKLTVTNNSTLTAAGGVQVVDTLPIGFRYRSGSAKLNGVSTGNPAISSNGRTLTFNVGTLAAGASAAIDYVAEVTAGTKLGDAINSAIATAGLKVKSNTASVKIKIRDDFMRTKSVLMGRVSTGACNDKTGEGPGGVEGVRIYLEDGTFVISDKRGMFHFEGVRSGLHVVQMDLDSLPEGYEAFACTENSRFAGRSFSQFVETQGGALWRTDFHVRKKPVSEKYPDVKNENGNKQFSSAETIAGKRHAADYNVYYYPDADDVVQNEVAASKDLKSTGTKAIAAKVSSTVKEPVQSKPSAPEDSEKGIKDKAGILTPVDKEILVNKTSGVRICLDSKLTPRLLVDDKEIPAKRIGFTMKDEKSGKAIYSYIGVDFEKTGNHTIQIQGIDPFGIARFKQTITVKRSGEVAAIRLKSSGGNVADGKTPVKLRLEIYDNDGTLIPAATALEIREGTLGPLKQPDIFADPPAAGSHPVVQMSREGEVLFQPVNQSGMYRVVLGYNNIRVEAETYVQPQMRDWILVGLAEGTAGYNTVSGNMENLKNGDNNEKLYQDGRVALFAKGQIKGKWLLTMAYDSARTKENSGNGLFQTVNPDTYYTLYGDTSGQQYDASSTNKLYLKIEREQFYAMFGDYDTGMTVTELSRYSRRMTGVKTEMQNKHFEINAFASETEQTYARDEKPGDGTSGIYRLSNKNIVPNSEKITIEVRDRFRSEVLISSRAMNRFTDYSIDYDAGTVIFKEPIYSRDENLNPIMIVAEYETISPGGKDYTYGGRAGVKLLDNKLKAGGSYIHEGQGDRSSNLYGVDASLKLNDSTKVRGEYARSDYDAGSASRSGNAYLVEASHSGKKVEAKAYYREQEEGFGVGQQPGSEAGTRKLGVEGAYSLNETVKASANIYRQYNLMTDATRDLAEGKLGYTDKKYGASVGFLHANDNLADGSNKESNQLTLGGKVLTLYDRLTIGINHAQSIGSNDNSDFPTRTTLGAEFAATKSLTLLAAQEFTWGTSAETSNTRIGMRSSPWKGAALNSSVERQFNENDDRVFANVGIKQNWQVNKDWKVDAGVDRSQTMAKSGNYQFNTNVQPSSGNREDFTAVSGGATYQVKKMTWDNRLEFRMADSEDKWGLISGLVKEVDSSWAWSGRLQVFQTSAKAGINTTKADLRGGLVYRPPQTRWIALNRLDFIIDKQSGSTGDFDSWRLINNLMVNYHPQKELELSLHYGAKYVQEKISDTDYSGYTDLIGAEGRYDINKYWDVGLHGSILHSWNASNYEYCSGLSVGYNVAQNAWLSLGYNLTGFQDKDFSEADFTAQGPFVRFRFKFDQNSVRDAANWINGN